MLDQRELELNLIKEIDNKATKEAALLDLKRKWEREDSSSSVLIWLVLFTILIGIMFLGYVLGVYFTEQKIVADLQDLARQNDVVKYGYGDFYYKTWSYLYDNYHVNLK